MLLITAVGFDRIAALLITAVGFLIAAALLVTAVGHLHKQHCSSVLLAVL